MVEKDEGGGCTQERCPEQDSCAGTPMSPLIDGEIRSTSADFSAYCQDSES